MRVTEHKLPLLIDIDLMPVFSIRVAEGNCICCTLLLLLVVTDVLFADVH